MRFSLLLFVLVFSLSGCFRQAYYVSPFNGMTAPYRTIPLHSDSVHAATYLNATFFSGKANDQGSDKKIALALDFSRSHNFGRFQAHYGAGGVAGNYRVSRYDSIGNSSTVNYRGINQRAGNYFFGGASADGAINFVVPAPHFEWRLLGVETSLRQEFGRYADFREHLPDSIATLIIRNRFFGTAGIYTEVVGDVGNGILGMKMSYGTVLGRAYHDPLGLRSNGEANGLRFSYFGLALHYTYEKVTGFVQLGTGSKAEVMFLGVNYRLGRK